MNTFTLNEQYGLRRIRKGLVPAYNGEIEFEIRDAKTNSIIKSYRERNLIKIQAKEILSHRLPCSQVWDPSGSAGTGAWVSSGIDVNQDTAVKYIVFGASYDQNGAPLNTADPRFYILDAVSGAYIPITIGPGADYNGGLINAIPISEPLRPLKRIERIYFESSYQPAGTPLLQDDVRALNNVIVMETTLQKGEYNGFNITSSDYFTITEVGLVAGKLLGHTGAIDCDPHSLFLEGSLSSPAGTNIAIGATATGTATISILPSELASINVINEGDTIKIVSHGDTSNDASIFDSQITPYYLVINKVTSGFDIVLDRTPVDGNNKPITGPIGIYRDSWRLFAHRILTVPVKVSIDLVITCRWRISMA